MVVMAARWLLESWVGGEGRLRPVSPRPQRRLTLQGYSGDHQSGDGDMGEGRGGGTPQGLLGSLPPPVRAECLQACLSRPGCLRNFQVSNPPDALPCQGG